MNSPSKDTSELRKAETSILKKRSRRKAISRKEKKIPEGVWFISFSSFLMDVSSEMVNSFLPLFMMATHGTSASTVGLIEGLIESKGFIVKFFSGAYSDYTGKRKRLAVIGYAMGTLTKPFYALDLSLESLIGARMVDRVGKGVRGPPRDALIADLTPNTSRGAAFGLRQLMDTVGALVGPLLATAILWWIPDDYQTVFFIAALPGLLSVWILQRWVREPHRISHVDPISSAKPNWLTSLPASFWWVCLLGAIFSLARVGQAFIILRIEESGVPVWQIPLILVATNLTFALTAFPFGKLSDLISNRLILGIGTVALISADLSFAASADQGMMMAAAVLLGLHLGMTQSPLSKMIVDSAPENLRGTAFGVFHLFWGLSMLLSSTFTGFFWEHHGSSATFELAAGVAMATLPFIALIPQASQFGKKNH